MGSRCSCFQGLIDDKSKLPQPLPLQQQQRSGTVLLVGGKGNVGTGCWEALREAGYSVHVIDPAGDGLTLEELSDDELSRLLSTSKEVIYAAEDGNRDHYMADGQLSRSNVRRFDGFIRRAAQLARERKFTVPRVSYIGGSWTKRASLSNSMTVSDDSPCKMSLAIPYEVAKIDAEVAAHALARFFGVRILFFDWASVVPNFSPNFTVWKMTAEALDGHTVTYSTGAYGRPLLHRKDAARAMLAIWTLPVQQLGIFHSFVIPGIFTSFTTFAHSVKRTMEEFGHHGVQLQYQEHTPEFLKLRCESALLTSLGFVPNEQLVRQGLDSTCREAVRRLKRRKKDEAARSKDEYALTRLWLDGADAPVMSERSPGRYAHVSQVDVCSSCSCALHIG